MCRHGRQAGAARKRVATLCTRSVGTTSGGMASSSPRSARASPCPPAPSHLEGRRCGRDHGGVDEVARVDVLAGCGACAGGKVLAPAKRATAAATTSGGGGRRAPPGRSRRRRRRCRRRAGRCARDLGGADRVEPSGSSAARAGRRPPREELASVQVDVLVVAREAERDGRATERRGMGWCPAENASGSRARRAARRKTLPISRADEARGADLR